MMHDKSPEKVPLPPVGLAIALLDFPLDLAGASALLGLGDVVVAVLVHAGLARTARQAGAARTLMDESFGIQGSRGVQERNQNSGTPLNS